MNFINCWLTLPFDFPCLYMLAQSSLSPRDSGVHKLCQTAPGPLSVSMEMQKRKYFRISNPESIKNQHSSEEHDNVL